MTKEEIKAYVANCSDKDKALAVIKQMVGENVAITEEELTKRMLQPDRPTGRVKEKHKLYLPMLMASIVAPIVFSIGVFMSQWAVLNGSYIMVEASPLYWIGYLAVIAVSVAASWMLFEKANRQGWKALIPFYSTWVMYDIIYGKGQKMFLLLIPIYNIYWIIKSMSDYGRTFGKRGGFLVGLVLLSGIFQTIMAFDGSEYRGAIRGASSEA